MPRTIADTKTFSVEEWDALASEGEFYREWFTALARLQDAIDQHVVEGMDGFTCVEQADRLRERVTQAVSWLQDVARRVDAHPYG